MRKYCITVYSSTCKYVYITEPSETTHRLSDNALVQLLLPQPRTSSGMYFFHHI